MIKNHINILEKEIYDAKIYIVANFDENNKIGKIVSDDIIFNNFDKKAKYIDFCQEEILGKLIPKIKKELKASISRNKALYYIRQLKKDFSKYKETFTEFKAYDLPDVQLFLFQHLKNTKQNLPEEFIGIKKQKYVRNKNLRYSENFKKLSDSIDKNFLNKIEHSFASIQLALLETVIYELESLEIFIENLSEEEFKEDYEFFEHKAPILTLSETIKLTNKDVNQKIDTLDKRQTALFFHYLERANLILDYTITDKANFAHYLTGHGKRQLEKIMGKDAIRLLKLDINKPNNEVSFKYENLNKLKEQLQNVINIIDEDIKQFEEG